ncbi:MAG: hypothetical protein U9Q94_03420 [Candidatus Bipolaricaulota bacterium]|nr:hypothetical protein [Candidatus Bipolaricaulota bacterium]
MQKNRLLYQRKQEACSFFVRFVSFVVLVLGNEEEEGGTKKRYLPQKALFARFMPYNRCRQAATLRKLHKVQVCAQHCLSLLPMGFLVGFVVDGHLSAERNAESEEVSDERAGFDILKEIS